MNRDVPLVGRELVRCRPEGYESAQRLERLIEGGIESVLGPAASLPKELESVFGESEGASKWIVQLRDHSCSLPEQKTFLD